MKLIEYNINPYFKELNKIEFIITYACTGKCKHCSEGDHKLHGERIDPKIVIDAVGKVAKEYNIETVMVFGGEPLLYPDPVYEIIALAKELGIPKRQVITNGYFSNNIVKIREVVSKLSECGVNDLLLSVDAFHQETIPLDVVKMFAKEAADYGIPTRLQPAWLVSREDDNKYNVKTREIINCFIDLGLFASEGNVIFPEGNALIYLSDYFVDHQPKNPYTTDPCNVNCISIEPNGDVLGSNLYQKDILKIIEEYTP